MAQQIIIEPDNGWLRLHLKELLAHRELIGFLARRDIMAQYKQAFFGVGWAVVRPVFAVGVYSLVFGKVAGLSSSGIPYPLFTLCGVVAWSLFATSLDQATISLIANTNLVTKVYFPRLVLPLASLGRGLMDLIVALAILAILMVFYGYVPGVTAWLFLFFLAAALVLAVGIGLFTSALCARYHDVKFAIPFFIQMWFWITPVAYGLENVPSHLRLFFHLNPMTWIIQGFRWSLLGVGDMNPFHLIMTAAISLLLFVGGLYYFRRYESEFADII
ncbi:O-antigen export system, permease protein [Olavius algarvensis associated proteobacterium Delta 3]|nr:O-antigen export system, permease protein [Olavius algarvensis associated proteobacterium Delta 3]CAB5139562.1 O-antigen export system, permease protein [Olavius algarvensis associated proteobacterium Delta 3]